MDPKISRKRSRESDVNDCSDCFPLSKRINSLCINNSQFPSSPEGLFQINVNVESQASCHTPSIWPSPPHAGPQYLPQSNCPDQNLNPRPNWPQASGSLSIPQLQTDSHQMHNYPQPPNVSIPNEPGHQSWNNTEPHSYVHRLKYNHDNMESEYYVNNRLLFDLYVERISRTGQPPAHPY